MRIARRRTPPHIPFIALADIAWQIIIFFLIAATFRQNFSLNVAMPTATTDASRVARKQVRIEAGETTLTMNGVPENLDTLAIDLAALLADARTDEERAVAVIARDDLSFQRNAEILYAIQQAGGVVVISEERRESASPAK